MIESPRLLLRELSVAEAAAIAAGRAPPGQRWADAYPLDGTLRAIAMLLRAAEQGALRPGFGQYQIIERATAHVIGDIGFHAAPDSAGIVELGYGIVPTARGRGLASESVRALSHWALHHPAVTTIVAQTEQDHWPSRHVLQATGFTLVLVTDGVCYYRLGSAP